MGVAAKLVTGLMCGKNSLKRHAIVAANEYTHRPNCSPRCCFPSHNSYLAPSWASCIHLWRCVGGTVMLIVCLLGHAGDTCK